jgi:hypothetical protein|tara:strand:+ start:791 stop:1204 length:414 start_codon:yes stop_codon:yes gene_type:complete
MISRFNFREKKLILFLIALIILLLTIFLQGKFIQKISDSRVNLNNEIENYELIKQQLAIIDAKINQESNQLSLDELLMNLNSNGFETNLDQNVIVIKNVPATKLQELIVSVDAQKNILKNVKIHQNENIFFIEIAID